MTQQELMKLAIAGGILYAAYKYAPWNWVKVGAAAAGFAIVAKRVPYVGEAIAV